MLDVGGRQAAGRPERFRRSLAEEAGENLRLNYVGMTRAQCQVVTWWADARTTTTSALHRFWARPARVGDPDPSYPADAGSRPRSRCPAARRRLRRRPRPGAERGAGAAPTAAPAVGPVRRCPVDLAARAVRADAGHRLAADLVLVADRRRPRGGPGRRGRQRARAGEGGRRERRSCPRRPRRSRRLRPQCAERSRRAAVADAGPAQRRRLRDRGARRAGGAGPDGRTTWPPPPSPRPRTRCPGCPTAT